MSNNELNSQFNIREYAIGSVNNRNRFEGLDFADTLQGKRDIYQSYFLHSAQIINYANTHFTPTGEKSAAGYKGVVATEWLKADIDEKNNLSQALEVARQSVLRLVNDFKVPASDVHTIFSGSKGFHIELADGLFGGFTPSPKLPWLIKQIAIEIWSGFELYLDTSIYHTVALIRIENTQNSKSGLYSIPLTVDELQTLTIDEIKGLAKEPRFISKDSVLSPIESLVKLKQKCELQLVSSVVDQPVASPASARQDNANVPAPDDRKINTVFKHCQALTVIQNKSDNKEPIGHENRVTLGTVLSAFGDEGKKRVHKILEGQDNYDKERTEYYIDAMKSGSYKPELCLTICGKDNLCPSIRAINRRSPVAFAYTYDKDIDEKIKKFIESYALDKIVAHFTDIIYSLIDQAYFRYADGVYTLLADNEVKTMLNDFLPFYYPKELITNTNLNALVERLKSHSEIRYEGRFNAEMYKLNLKNGIFDLMDRTLSPHTPEFMSNIQLPFSYDPQATSPVFDTFLSSIFESRDVEDYILKVWSYLLLPTYSFQKIFVWYGTGRNGKGTLSRIIEAMIGTGNTAHEEIHELANGRFSSINLKDKLVNFSAELKSNELDLSMLKKLSGGDMIAADKKYKDKITFQNVARLIIMANDLPRFSEIGQAITQRFEFIEFPKSFLKERDDTALIDKLKNELPGIFNRVISMMPTIFDSKGAINFKGPEILEKQKEAMLSNLSTVIEFINENCEKDEKGSVPAQRLFNNYRTWGRNSGYQPVGKKTFNNILRETLHHKVEPNTAESNAVYVFGIKQTAIIMPNT